MWAHLDGAISILINNSINLVDIICQWSEGQSSEGKKHRIRKGDREDGLTFRSLSYTADSFCNVAVWGGSKTVVNCRLPSFQLCIDNSFGKRHSNIKPERKLLMDVTWVMTSSLSLSLRLEGWGSTLGDTCIVRLSCKWGAGETLWSEVGERQVLQSKRSGFQEKGERMPCH